MNNFKNFLPLAALIFLTGCLSNQSFYLKVDSVSDFTLLNYEDFNLETNSENLSPEVADSVNVLKEAAAMVNEPYKQKSVHSGEDNTDMKNNSENNNQSK